MPVKKGQVLNPTGKGGFGDNPQNRSHGRWRKEDSIPYWQHFFLSLTVAEFKEWISKNKEANRTMAQEIAYKSVIEARKELNYLKEVTDRTSGKAQMSIDHTSKGDSIQQPVIVVQSSDAASDLEKL